jgi:hypothetical protein
MPLAGFETAVPASERPQTHTLDRSANEISLLTTCYCNLLQADNYFMFLHENDNSFLLSPSRVLKLAETCKG